MATKKQLSLAGATICTVSFFMLAYWTAYLNHFFPAGYTHWSTEPNILLCIVFFIAAAGCFVYLLVE